MSTDITIPSEQQQDRPTVARMIQSLVPEISRAVPKGMDGDRLARLALTTLRKTPKLAQCTPESFAGSLMTAAGLGMEPNTPTGECYLVPYEDKQRRVVEAQLIIGYQGFTKLFYQHPLAASIDAQAVFERDEFDYAYGSAPYLTHKPAREPVDRGEIIYYYAVATLTNGGGKFVVLTPDEVKALRSGREGPSGKIADPQRWMERKTAVRQLLKLLPRSTELNRALAVDEQVGSALRVEQVQEARELPALEQKGGES